MTAKITAALHLSLPAAGLSIQLPVEYRVDNDRVWVSPLQLLKFKVLRGPLASAQYACSAYVDTLLKHGIVPSMSRPGNPYDNAKCERFMNTLKQEEIYCSEYKDINDLRANLSHFLETYYNIKRLHSALSYQSPEAFEQKTARSPAASQTAALPVTSFRRHEEIYPSDGRS